MWFYMFFSCLYYIAITVLNVAKVATRRFSGRLYISEYGVESPANLINS